jgi:hypothetical protein
VLHKKERRAGRKQPAPPGMITFSTSSQPQGSGLKKLEAGS